MKSTLKNISQKPPFQLTKVIASAPDDTLRNLAFENSLQANIITRSASGKIIMANNAACALLGYSEEEILTKSRSAIFDVNESSFKKMLKQIKAHGHSIAQVTGVKKNGIRFFCEITSAVFMDVDGVENAITTIADLSESILKQKIIDSKKNQLVADNIAVAKSKQRGENAKKNKVVASNIRTAQAKSDARLAHNNEWIKYIAKTSYDVMWDWNIAKGEIYVGDSVREVFGYPLKENLISFEDFSGCLEAAEKYAIEKRLSQILASGSSTWSDTYKLKRYNGSLANTTCRASIVRDEQGKAIRLIGAIQDVSRLQELEINLAEQITIRQENHGIFQLAAKLSYDGIWDWNLITNEFFLGDGFKELFGSAIKENKDDRADWHNYLHPEDKESMERGLKDAIESSATSWEHAYRFVKADGTLADVFVRASIIRDSDGKAQRMIGVIHDLSRQKELENKLDIERATNVKQFTDYKESYKLIFNSSSDLIYDIDLLANEISISDAFEKQFGYKITTKMTPEEDWASHIHPDDKKAVLRDYFRMLASQDNEWKCNYRFFRADGSVANILSSSIVLRNGAGMACRIIISMNDISKQTVLEERLELEIKLKEKRIAEASDEAKEAERSDIGKELHDNVNQLLGASRLYLELAKCGGENTEMYLSRSSEYTITAIEEIRKLTKGLTTDIIKNIGLSEAIEKLIRDTMELNPLKISCTLRHTIDRITDKKFKLNIFRIVQEQLNNILKHARATEVKITLLQNKKSIILTISDNGVGFDVSKSRKGIGVDNITSRSAAYNGTARFISQPGEGCVLTATFSIPGPL